MIDKKIDESAQNTIVGLLQASPWMTGNLDCYQEAAELELLGKLNAILYILPRQFSGARLQAFKPNAQSFI